ncbi:MAG: tRNA pseudouridine(38-40) synthase TruA [Bacillota bacterium]|nr:tRNA pseudouridine(38-40) synthase TruA [Bacillota bacterium]
MTRILIYIEYDGTGYAGWQNQKNASSIQQALEECLKKLTREDIAVTGAGRTDAGAHAQGQAAHFDTASRIPAEKFAYAMNSHLPRSIRVIESREVGMDFHARFSARGKWYRYTIYNRPHALALNRLTCLHVREPLDITAMEEAVPRLTGTHDFAAFAASGGDQKTTVRTIYSAKVTKEGAYIHIDITGNAFLFNMVRIIAGTLIEIGRHRLERNALEEMLEGRSRLSGGPTAPAKGLTLMKVYYDWDGELTKD